MTDRVVPGTVQRVVAKVDDFAAYEGHAEPCELADANVVTSLTGQRGLNIDPATLKPVEEELHAPVIDLDVPVTYVPSTTPGHGHLYVDVPMPESDMWRLLEVMVEVGLVEEGYLNASQMRGHTSVRLPWVKKETPPAPQLTDPTEAWAF